jgi:16S rRNA (guanine527-N7)-methyltransferase
MAFNSELTQILGENGIELTTDQHHQFARYYALLVEWNEKMNLTAITEEGEVYLKHFFDSLTLAFHYDLTKVTTIADIGAGAGFPSIPLKIAFPHLKLTIVESLNKRITFLKEVVSELGLVDVEFHHGRAEDMGRLGGLRDTFDLVTARAVARLNVLSELCMPFVRPGGVFAAMKGAKAEEEVAEAKTACKVLKGRVRASFALTLPLEQSERSIILIDKVDATPKQYPRKAGTPNKQPIV